MLDKDKKNVQFANFNITYSIANESDSLPMLTYFDEIIMPIFKSNYVRQIHDKNQGKKTEYSFCDVHVKDINGEYVLAGSLVKNTSYQIKSQLENGHLMSKDSDVPTAPYSRFIIALKNHRMFLVKNESLSPDIRSFQSTFKEIAQNYITKTNKSLSNENQLPMPCINIVDLPQKENIEEVFSTIQRIQRIEIKLYPLNNDIDPSPIFSDIRKMMANVDSQCAKLQVNSPSSLKNVEKLIEKSSGLVEPVLYVKKKSGERETIKSDKFTSCKPIFLPGSVEEEHDKYLMNFAIKTPVFNTTSEANLKKYEECLEIIKKYQKI